MIFNIFEHSFSKNSLKIVFFEKKVKKIGTYGILGL